MHILVIDDEPEILAFLNAVLEEEFEVHTCNHGKHALTTLQQLKAQDQAVAAAFVDLGLGSGCSGLDVAQKLQDVDARMNIILMTGDPNFSFQEIPDPLQNHVLLLEKPFSVNEVMLMARYFRRSWMRDDALEKGKKALKNEILEKEDLIARSVAVLETASDCIITVNSEGLITEWNPAAESTFGYSRDDVLGKALSDTIIPHGFRSKHNEGMSHYMNTGEGPILGKRIEIEALHKHGYHLPVELTVNPYRLGEDQFFTAYLRDISEQHRAAAQMLLQSTALEAAANGIVITDPEGNIVWGNTAFCKLTGYPFEELMGCPIGKLSSGQHDKAFYKSLWDTILSGNVWAGEISNRRKNGELYLEKMTITPVKGDDGKVTHFIAIKKDITEDWRLEVERDQNAQAQKIINYFATSLLGSNSEDEILWDIAHNCISQMEWEDAVVYMLSDDKQTLHQRAAYGSNKARDYTIIDPIVIPVGEGIVGAVAQSGHAERVGDVLEDPRYIVDDESRRSELAVPIVYENEVLGVIDSEHSEPHFYTEHHQQILEAIASLAANKLVRTQTLNLIEESERKYRNIFETIHDVYAEVDYDTGLITEITPSIERASGYTREEMIGSPMAQYFSPYGVPPELMADLLEAGTADDYNVNLVTKAGDLRTVSFSVDLLRREDGRPDKITGTMRDITERTEAEATLAESEERLRIILNQLPTGVLIVDPETGLVDVANEATRQIIQRPLNHIVHTPVLDILNVADKDFLACSAQESSPPRDILLTRNDGSELPLLMTKTALMILDKSYCLITMLDNSTQKEAEEALRTNIEMKTNFVSNLSHELRTPMTSIYGFSGTILRDKDMPEEVREDFIRVIFEESQRLTRLIENVLDISRMEAGRMKYTMQPIQMDRIIEEALKTQQVIVRDKSINLQKDVLSDPPLIEADQDSLNQLVINLVSNAIKFSDPGSAVHVGLHQEQDLLTLTVKDEGVGIPEADLERIFEKFYRVQHQGREDQGTGIGLAIVKEIVERHHGHLDVTSTLGEGTCFTVQFPIIEGMDGL